MKKALSRNDKIVRDAALEGEKALFQKMTASDYTDTIGSILAEYVSTMFEVGSQTEQNRTKAAEASATLAGWSRKGSQLHERLESDVKAALDQERSPVIRQLLLSVQQALAPTV